MNNSSKNTRIAAADTVRKIVDHKKQLNRVLAHVRTTFDSKDQQLISEIVHGVVRWYWQLDAIAAALLKKPMQAKDRNVYFLLLVGLYQLKYMRIPPYACVSETVNAVSAMNKPWAKGLVNAVLRTYIRNSDRASVDKSNMTGRYSHPQWMIDLIRCEWPQHWVEILQANNTRPQMTLRVNLKKCAVEQYLSKLAECGIEAHADETSEVGIRLTKRIRVSKLPDFDQGEVSVQNTASQLVSPLMDIQPGHRVLDACSAPGGKLMHMMEVQPEISDIVAIDVDQSRCLDIRENLKRCRQNAIVLCEDATHPEDWWDGIPFDRILVDVPCSALGIVNKHPDIKHHRSLQDLEGFAKQQQDLLEALLPLVKKGGKLVYTTCTIIASENQTQIAQAVKRHCEFKLEELSSRYGLPTGCGRQRLQGIHDSDGFFYSSLIRDTVN